MAWRQIFREIVRRKRELEEALKKAKIEAPSIPIPKSDKYEGNNVVLSGVTTLLKLENTWGNIQTIHIVSQDKDYRLVVYLDDHERWDRTWDEFAKDTALPEITAVYRSDTGYILTLYNMPYSNSAIVKIITNRQITFNKILILYTYHVVRKIV